MGWQEAKFCYSLHYETWADYVNWFCEWWEDYGWEKACSIAECEV